MPNNSGNSTPTGNSGSGTPNNGAKGSNSTSGKNTGSVGANNSGSAPSSLTGDILAAMQAEQANAAALYQLQQAQAQTLVSLESLQQFANDQLKKQTKILENIYSYMLKKWGPAIGAPQGTQTNPANASGKGSVPNANIVQPTPQMSLFNDMLAQARNKDSALEKFIQAQEDEFQRTAQSIQDAFEANQPAGTPLGIAPGLEAAAAEKADLIQKAEGINKILQGLNEKPGSGAGAIRGAGGVLGGIAGEAVGGLAGDALSAALVPALGPLGPVVGQIGGEIIGKHLEKTVGAAFDALGDLFASFEESGRRARDRIIQAGFDKIQQDVCSMGTYQIEVYEQATRAIYSSWDKNISSVSATMGYTKEAVNSLQDSVAQRLESLGYSQAINAADYLDELNSVLSANLGGKLAEVFASQSLILEKAIPQFDATAMAQQFAAIYTNAAKEGNDGESAMIEAMNQIAGATKAVQETTDGNNQFIRSVPAFLQKAQEIVARAGGATDKVASLTTEMMAAEGPLAALAPQLSGFTGELVDRLVKQNDATSVALRSMMHGINADIGVSATDFMNSFMTDTKGTLVTAFKALDDFIQKNENPAARQEFLASMEGLFGIQGEKLAQLDFGYIGEQLSQTNANLNTAALLDAQALLKSGESTTLEQQLVNNTANMLLAQNAVKDTLDNRLMRKIEQNELHMERLVWETTQTQSVNLAEDTMGFFVKVKDIIIDLLDPLGLFKAASSAISGAVSASTNIANYALTSSLSSVGSTVANEVAGAAYTFKNTVGGAAAAIAAANATDANSGAMQMAMMVAGTAGSYQAMIAQHTMKSIQNESKAAATAMVSNAEEAVGNYENTVEKKQEQAEKRAIDAEQERLRQTAAESNQAAAAVQAQRDVENHQNIAAAVATMPLIQDEVVKVHTTYTEGNQALTAELSNFAATYVAGNLELVTRVKKVQEDGFPSVVRAIENSRVDVSELSDIREGIQRVVTLFSTYIEFIDRTMSTSDKNGLRMAPSDRAQILGEGLYR